MTKIKNNAYEDLLDAQEADVRFRPEFEQAWEKQRNVLLEKHPFIVGYSFMTGLLFWVMFSHLSMFLISFLFLYLISDFMTNDVRRWIPFIPKAFLFSVLYIVIIVFLTLLTYRVIPNFVKQLPGLATRVQVEAMKHINEANKRWDLKKYVDPKEIQSAVVAATTSTIAFLMNQIPPLWMGFIYFIFAGIINLFLYHNREKIDQVFSRKSGSLMYFLYRFADNRLKIFYFYFKRVMSGQIIISSVNTVISAIAIVALNLPNPVLLIALVFFCGLFPVVGNLISNTVLTITAFISIGLLGAGICLILLVGIHKLEYFLNSKIISEIVNLPMIITLSALIVSEVLLGIVGLILAIPLVLFIRHELEHIPGISESGNTQEIVKITV